MDQRLLQEWLEAALESRFVQTVGGAINASLQLRSPVAVKVGESKLFAQTLDRIITLLVIKLNLWERAERRFVRKAVRPGDVAVDVGANVGQYTVKFSRLVGNEGKVIAFEPAPGNFHLLRMAVEVNHCSNAVVHEMAVTDALGLVDLHLSDLHHGDHRIFKTKGQRTELSVRTTSLDEHLSAEPKIDFVKIDVQGAEPLVLRGMRKLIRENVNLTIMTEFSPQLLRAADTNPPEFLEEIRGLGLEVSILDKNGDLARSNEVLESLASSSAPATLVLTRK